MVLRIYFRRKTMLQPTEFDISLQQSSKDPPYAMPFAESTADGLRKIMAENGADFAPSSKPMRNCPNIEYRLRIHKRERAMFWDAPILNCDSSQRVATQNTANLIREVFADVDKNIKDKENNR